MTNNDFADLASYHEGDKGTGCDVGVYDRPIGIDVRRVFLGGPFIGR